MNVQRVLTYTEVQECTESKNYTEVQEYTESINMYKSTRIYRG